MLAAGGGSCEEHAGHFPTQLILDSFLVASPSCGRHSPFPAAPHPARVVCFADMDALGGSDFGHFAKVDHGILYKIDKLQQGV